MDFLIDSQHLREANLNFDAADSQLKHDKLFGQLNLNLTRKK